jgi:rhodanese-related sulfurtransferase
MPRSHIASKTRITRKIRRRNLTVLWIGLGVVLLVMAGLWIFRPKTQPAAGEAATPATAAELTAAQAYQKYQEGVFFLDVRTQEEWNDFHIKGSTLIPLDELQDRMGELPKDRDIVVVCLTGHRSLTAVNLLQQAGFTRLASLSGGMQAWMDANYPTE